VTDVLAGDGDLRAIPRTTRAVGGPAVSRAVAARRGLPTAVWGMLIVIAAEGTLFACLVAAYFYLRFNNAAWPPRGVPEPRVVVPLILVAVLVAMSIPMQLASLRARAGRAAAAFLLVLVALVVQCGYLAYEVHDFRDQLERVDITWNAYTSIYYTLLGAAHAHVAVGVLLNVWLLTKLARGLTTYRANAAQAIAWYWHAVNAFTVVVALTLLSARV
jgi:cytochrome c oxidase subunit III